MKNILIVLSVVLSIQSTAQVINYNTEFLVTLLDVDYLTTTSVCKLVDGGFVVVYGSNWHASGIKNDIYAQVYNSDKSFRGEKFKVNIYTNESQIAPEVSPLSDGGFIVIWQSMGQDGSGWAIFGQIFNADLTRRSEEFQVNTYAGASQAHPSVCTLMDDQIIAAWYSAGNDTTDNMMIVGQSFSSNSRKIKAEFQINTNRGWGTKEPSLAGLEDGGFVVVWEVEGNYNNIYGQVFNSDRSRRGDEFRVNTHTRSNKYHASVVGLSDGEFLVVWFSYYQDGSKAGIYGQAYNSDLSKKGEEFRINTFTKGMQVYPDICKIDNNNIIVVWSSQEEDNKQSYTLGQVFNPDLIPVGKEFRINSNSQIIQEHPTVSSLNNNQWVVAWQTKNSILGKYYLNDPITHELKNFKLNYPQYDETITEKNPKFVWELPTDIHFNYTWEIEYNIYLSEDLEFTSPQIIEGITNTEYRVDSLESNKTYFWKVLAKNIEGDSLWSSNVTGFFIDPDATVGISGEKNKFPKDFNLSQNYPNPFNPSTKIKYTIPVETFYGTSSQNVTLKVYDVLGKEVATLVNKEQSAGSYEVEFNTSASFSATNSLSSGVYFYRLRAGSFVETKKMLLLR